jgi:hypothetical protein
MTQERSYRCDPRRQGTLNRCRQSLRALHSLPNTHSLSLSYRCDPRRQGTLNYASFCQSLHSLFIVLYSIVFPPLLPGRLRSLLSIITCLAFATQYSLFSFPSFLTLPYQGCPNLTFHSFLSYLALLGVSQSYFLFIPFLLCLTRGVPI